MLNDLSRDSDNHCLFHSRSFTEFLPLSQSHLPEKQSVIMSTHFNVLSNFKTILFRELIF